MALDWCPKLVFAQYLENGWTEFNQIWYTHYHGQGLGWCCKLSFFSNLQLSYGPWLIIFRNWLIFVQYLENGWTEFNQILHKHYHWHDLSTISSSNRVVPLNTSLSSDSDMLGLWADPLTILVFAGNKKNHCLPWVQNLTRSNQVQWS